MTAVRTSPSFDAISIGQSDDSKEAIIARESSLALGTLFRIRIQGGLSLPIDVVESEFCRGMFALPFDLFIPTGVVPRPFTHLSLLH